ncbi:hypothetical protein GCM10007962_32720 [Yeosuana aromativorans]|uniref:Uncharacterized protein n=1 Tax=Yeosuana aromativorans TaxID=288019 RepID=A0A8J3FIZ7_9FLAO|nr:hypothetical protein [Yeosuana aromativorans]GGK35829.1 hypothetical protein GCM10007962_32720 [Yeosuana aromativorans]
MKRYSIEKIEFPNWEITWNEIRMGHYNINAVRNTGNQIGFYEWGDDDSRQRLVTDIVNLELSLRRKNTYPYWNSVFTTLLKTNKIPFYNKFETNEFNDSFSWEIEILENIFLSYNSENDEIILNQNSELLFIKKWKDLNGNDFNNLVKKINFRF